MKTHEFTLLLQTWQGSYELLEDTLFESGCDDATLSSRNGIVYLNFDRQADDLESAVISAVRQVEQTALNLVVRSVEPSDLVTCAEIARRLNRSRQSVQQLIAGSRGEGDFPLPVAGVTAKTMLWSWLHIMEWLLSKGKLEDKTDYDNAVIMKQLNDLLSVRKDDKQIRNIQRLAKLLGKKNSLKEFA